MLTYTPESHSWKQDPEETAPQPVIAVLYERTDDGKRWQIAMAATPEHDLHYIHLLTGGLEYTDKSGNYLKTDADKINIEYSDLNRCALWISKRHVKGIQHYGQDITAGQAWEKGLKLLHRPLKYTQSQIEDAQHEDGLNITHCEICQGYWTSEEHCCHLCWRDGGGMCEGVGAQDVDQAEVKQSLFDLWNLIDPAILKQWAEAMAKGTFDMSGDNEWRSRIYIDLIHGGRDIWAASELNLDYLVDLCGNNNSDAEHLFWPGIAWLSSLDNHDRCKPYKQITLGWLQEFLHSRHYTMPTSVFYHRTDKMEWQTLSALKAGDTLVLPIRRLKDRTRNTLEFLSKLSATTHARIYDPSSGQECLYRIECPRQNTKEAWARIAYVVRAAGEGSPWTLPDYDLLED